MVSEARSLVCSYSPQRDERHLLNSHRVHLVFCAYRSFALIGCARLCWARLRKSV